MIGRIWRKLLSIFFKIFNPRFWNCVMYDIPKVYFKKRLSIGRRVHINDKVFINAVGGVTIGDYCVLSHGVVIISTENQAKLWTSRYQDEDIHINKPIEIGENVWLCANAMVCSGTKIAKNSIVAAGAVVTNDLLEENCLYGGVPAKKIKGLKEL